MQNIKTLTVYLGSSGHARPVFKEAAQELGQLIAQHNYDLVYGGMDAGLMGLLALNALKAGGRVTGIIPRKLKDSERILPNLTETILVEDLWDRKKRMFQRADAILALPGGFGTLDESLEVLYWGHLQRHQKPLVLINIEGYWSGLIDYLSKMEDFDPKFLITVEEPKDVFAALKDWIPPDIPHKETDHLPHFEDEITRNTDEPIIIDKASIENTYFAVCALGLKQLGKHNRHIGFLNKNGIFDGLLQWFQTAEQEKFITAKCLKLFDSAQDLEELRKILDAQKDIEIDLHNDKWGEKVDV